MSHTYHVVGAPQIGKHDPNGGQSRDVSVHLCHCFFSPSHSEAADESILRDLVRSIHGVCRQK